MIITFVGNDCFMREKIGRNLMSLVGKTPLIYLNKLTSTGRIAAKLEFFNPTGSVKDRIVLNMICDAEKRGYLQPDSIIIEPTSGNTGIGLACFCAIKDYKLILVMPDTVDHERRRLLAAYGAELVITPGEGGMRGAIEKAEALMENNDRSFMLQQFNNTSNPQTHERTTAVEIWEDTDRNVGIFVSGVGTGGTVTGVGKYLKKKNSNIRIIAVEPKASSVISGGRAGRHRIQGLGAGFIPRVFDISCVDEVITVDDDDAIEMCRKLAIEEGILAGISSGAAAWAAKEVSEREENRDKLTVVIFPDRGDKYLNTGLFDAINN